MILFLAVAATVLMVFILLVLWGYMQSRRVDVFRRMRSYNNEYRLLTESEEKNKNELRALARNLGKLLAKVHPMTELDLKMEQAGLPIMGGEYLVLTGGAALLIGLVAGILTHDFFNFLMMVLAVFVISWLFILHSIKKRQERFVNQLSDCLMTISNSLRAGFSFLQAIDLISQEMEPPISEEFGRVTRETAVGNSLDSALKAMVARMQNSDFALVVTAVTIQREVGGNLAQILDNISGTIDERIRMRREIMVLTSQGRLSAWVLLALPIVMGLFMNYAVEGYMDVVLNNLLGRIVLVICVILEIIGYFIIQKIIDIDV